MRDFKSMKRQRGRNRKPGGGGGGGGGGNNPNRAFDSNGPEGIKVRGNAQHVYERYQQLARDAASAGDRVLAENHLQHAEHYFRLIRAMQPQRPVSEIAARDAFTSGFDIDFEDESGIPQVSEGAEGEGQDDGDRDRGESQDGRRGDREQGRDHREFRDRDRSDRDRGDFRREERPESRDRDNRDRDRDRDRDNRSQRDERPAEAAVGGEGRREGRRERFDRQRGERRPRYSDESRGEAADPLAVVEPQAAPLVERADEGSPVLRANDGGESHMPAFLGRAAPPAGDDEAPADKPKRAPRKRKTAEASQPEDA